MHILRNAVLLWHWCCYRSVNQWAMLPRPSLLKMLLTGAYIVACSSAHCYGWHLNQLCQVCPYCTLDWNQMQGCNHCHHGFLHKFRSLQYHDAAEHSHSVCVCAMHPVPFCDLLRVIVSTRFLLSSSVLHALQACSSLLWLWELPGGALLECVSDIWLARMWPSPCRHMR